MSISLVASLIPDNGIKERNKFVKQTTINCSTSLSIRQKQRTQNIKLGQLFLTIAQEAANAVLENRLKDFDALIKNFGCQITALEVQQLVRSPQIRSEAEKIKIKTEELSKKYRAGSPFVETHTVNLIGYLQTAGLDFDVSLEMARLIRFRMLCIVNTNKLGENGKEVPITNLRPLTNKIKKLNTCVDKLILGIQAEESILAAHYIKAEADQLIGNETDRASILQRLVSELFWRQSEISEKYSPITSVPLFYNTETVFRRTVGLVLLKNKCTLLEQPIENAQEIKVFVKMPKAKVISFEKVKKKSDDEALLVIEGYVNSPDLAVQIAQIGFFNILFANLAPLPQYASGTCQDVLSDNEAAAELNTFAGRTDIIENSLSIDHIYCASLGEER